MAAVARPKATAAAHSWRLNPCNRGRQRGSRTIAPTSTRRKAAAAGPTEAKRCVATAEPNCTESTAPSTKTMGWTPGSEDVGVAVCSRSVTGYATAHQIDISGAWPPKYVDDRG